MAQDKPGKTTREYIVKTLTELLESCEVKRVVRGKKGNIQKEFNALPDTDFPIIVLDCGLPQPEIKYSSRQQGIIDEVRSSLDISIYVYLRTSEGLCGHEDEQVSFLLGNIWKILCNNPNIGKVMTLIPMLSPSMTYQDVYCYFTIDLKVQYIHDKDTI